MLMTLNIFSNLNFNFDCSEALFYKSKINSHGVYIINKKKGRKVLLKSRNRNELLLTKISEVVKQIIRMHQTVIML